MPKLSPQRVTNSLTLSFVKASPLLGFYDLLSLNSLYKGITFFNDDSCTELTTNLHPSRVTSTLTPLFVKPSHC